jgi:hypothetical protein
MPSKLVELAFDHDRVVTYRGEGRGGLVRDAS